MDSMFFGQAHRGSTVGFCCLNTHLVSSQCWFLVYMFAVVIHVHWWVGSPSRGTNNMYEPWHDKTNNMAVRQAQTQISLGIRPDWSESSLSAWKNLGSSATHWAQSEDSDQTGRLPRLIWVFAGRTVTLLVLSCRGSYVYEPPRVVNT